MFIRLYGAIILKSQGIGESPPERSAGGLACLLLKALGLKVLYDDCGRLAATDANRGASVSEAFSLQGV